MISVHCTPTGRGRMRKRRKRTRWEPGHVIVEREIVTISGVRVTIPEADQLVHRHEEIVAASIREVVVFHSTAEGLLPHAGDLPFAVIADPDKRLYIEFGV